jgi:hypothetical protein
VPSANVAASNEIGSAEVTSERQTYATSASAGRIDSNVNPPTIGFVIRVRSVLTRSQMRIATDASTRSSRAVARSTRYSVTAIPSSGDRTSHAVTS